MRYLVLIIKPTVCLIFGIVIISKGYYFFGGCAICGFILFLLQFVFIFIKDLEWISESLVNEDKLTSIKKETALYDFVFDSIYKGRIKKGMSLEELKKVMQEFDHVNHYLDLGFGIAQSKRGSKNYFYGYGKGMPTPRIVLTVKKGKLASVRQYVGLINY
ncbi:MAG: hypothetical protein Q8O13_01270 [Candidatus Omnitrophota bacterium]|nr:hypothetical protein [Candidatus Omnitrophota bacterium]